jgi:hypothetical protein
MRNCQRADQEGDKKKMVKDNDKKKKERKRKCLGLFFSFTICATFIVSSEYSHWTRAGIGQVT